MSINAWAEVDRTTCAAPDCEELPATGDPLWCDWHSSLLYDHRQILDAPQPGNDFFHARDRQHCPACSFGADPRQGLCVAPACEEQAVLDAEDEEYAAWCRLHGDMLLDHRLDELEFVTRLGQWLTTGPRPIVLGVDANSPAGVGDADEHYWEVEKEVWSADATHGLQDAWRLTRSAFTPTHVVRGGREVRFDHLWVSEGMEVRSLQHHLEAARLHGSDHALVVADLELFGLDATVD